MNQLLKELMDAGKADALKSVEALQEAAKELGYGADEIAATVAELGKFPLSDEDLHDAAGGIDFNLAQDPTSEREGNARSRLRIF